MKVLRIIVHIETRIDTGRTARKRVDLGFSIVARESA